MQQFAAVQQTNILKLPTFFMRFQSHDRISRVKKSKITSQNTFNGYNFHVKGNHESIKNEKTLFQVFLQNIKSCFNLQTAKFVYLCFSSIVQFLKFLSHFLWCLEARGQLTPFYSNVQGNRANFLAILYPSLLLGCKSVE